MKASKTIKTPARKASTTTKTIALCDFCEAPTADHYGNERVCSVCRRDICQNHTKQDWDDPSDYPARWCPPCAELWPPIRSKMIERHDDEEERLLAQVRAESLAAPKTEEGK